MTGSGLTRRKISFSKIGMTVSSKGVFTKRLSFLLMAEVGCGKPKKLASQINTSVARKACGEMTCTAI